MKYTRWYDKDVQLKLIMETLEKIDDETKLSIAFDLIQIVLKSKGKNCDGFLEKTNSVYIADRRRWYDRDETLHSAVEMLKHLDSSERNEILREILYSVLDASTNNPNQNK